MLLDRNLSFLFLNDLLRIDLCLLCFLTSLEYNFDKLIRLLLFRQCMLYLLLRLLLLLNNLLFNYFGTWNFWCTFWCFLLLLFLICHNFIFSILWSAAKENFLLNPTRMASTGSRLWSVFCILSFWILFLLISQFRSYNLVSFFQLIIIF